MAAIASAPALTPPEARVIEAALACVARWGVTKTSLDDIARQAGVSRATVYRLSPGGKASLLRAVVAHELGVLTREVTEALAAADTLEDRLVAGIHVASRAIAGHAALQLVLAHEPELVLPHVAFDRFDDVLAAAAALVGPHLVPFVGTETALRTGEWVARLVLSYSLAPSPAYDLTVEDDARRFTRTFLLPGLTRP
ncbi:MAG TPA: TetR family transcriptional regulator [Acidimicrobiales bacterium]|nr:TetR family transcriptional regulator [Acidimicrobiales bacterium]